MELSNLLAQLHKLNQPIWQTKDVVALLNISTSTASKSLRRLEKHGHIVKLRKGLWAFKQEIEPLMLPEYLTAPMPSYISLQSALYYHGMIEQIPEIIYAISLERTKIFHTPIGTISIHHIVPEFYFGFDVIEPKKIKIATKEKALLDLLYLTPAKTRWFSSLPEITLDKSFNLSLCQEWIKKIPDQKRQTFVTKRLNEIVETQKNFI